MLVAVTFQGNFNILLKNQADTPIFHRVLSWKMISNKGIKSCTKVSAIVSQKFIDEVMVIG
jgi:hypothetical protein